jgi:hypothetical protein
MTSLTAAIGNFPKLLAPSVDTKIGQSLLIWLTKLKDDMVEETGSEKFIEYETLEHALNPVKKDEAKHTWHGNKKVPLKDENDETVKENGKVVYEEEEGDWQVSKFISIQADAKRHFTCLLNRYLFEAQNYYNENNNSFGTDDEVLANVAKHSIESEDPCVAGMIIKSCDGPVDVSARLNDNDFNSDKFKSDALHGYLKARALDYFKNNNSAPASQIGVLITRFLDFCKLFCVFSMNSMWVRRKTFNEEFFFTQLRNIYTLVLKDQIVYSEELEGIMHDLLKSTKDEKAAATEKRKAAPKKSPKKSAKDDSEDDEEETPVKKVVKKTAKKPVKKPVKKIVEEIDDEDDEDDDFDDVDEEA